MSISAINEQLLRAIGVGVALVRADDLSFVFFNQPFAEWFGTPDENANLPDLIEALRDTDLSDLSENGLRFSSELQIKRKRRTLVFAINISLTRDADEPLWVVECQNITRIRELESMIDSYSAMVERNTRELEREKERVERLLLNLMPRSVYEEFKTFGVVTPQLYPQVSVVMLDFVNFTDFAARTDPTVTLGELNDIFTAFDRIVEQYGCERIKTIGDAYLAVSGMPEPDPDHGSAVAHCAIRFLRYLERRNQSHPHKWQARVGLGCGAVVGSVVGVQKYVYDVFGPAVNLAARLQVYADPMTIAAPVAMRESLEEHFELVDQGPVSLKGLGDVSIIRIDKELGRPGSRGVSGI